MLNKSFFIHPIAVDKKYFECDCLNYLQANVFKYIFKSQPASAGIITFHSYAANYTVKSARIPPPPRTRRRWYINDDRSASLIIMYPSEEDERKTKIELSVHSTGMNNSRLSFLLSSNWKKFINTRLVEALVPPVSII